MKRIPMKTNFLSAFLGCVLFTNAYAQTLKLGHITPPSHVWHQVAEKMDTALQAKSGGKMKLNISPLGKLGNEAQMINLLQSGAMPIGILTVGAISNREDAFLAWSLPYLFDDVEHATAAVQTPAAQEMLKSLENHGMIGMGYGFAGMRHVLSITPIASVDDLKNKKVRSFPNSVYQDFWTTIGAAPTAMPLPEVAPALTTNLLDAVDIDLDALVGMKFHQQAPYLTLTNHMAFPSVIVVSKKYWDKLSAEEQKILAEAIEEAESFGYAQAIAADAENLKKALADGAKQQDVDVQSFKDVGASVTQKYTQNHPLRAQFHEQVKHLKH